jgi:flagellar M-ring protein FliF
MLFVQTYFRTRTLLMATNPQVPNSFMGFFQSALGRNLALGAGLALVLSIMAGVFLWGQKPNYGILLTNFSDKDGGAIIASLQTMNVPYQFSEGGNAILVPAEMVYDARLKLAAQGLPRGGNVGFELMENQKMGTSQFIEQVNYQRALEGELARTISSIGVVQGARVHLAIPKQSVFVREKQTPTASVLVNLNSGRTLDKQQVNAVIHLVSSSVPELTSNAVTVVDQTGKLLSGNDKSTSDTAQLDPEQMKYVKEIQESIRKRVESILAPMVGEGNVHAQATADIDFTRSEQASETYKPNATPETSAVRSLQTKEAASMDPVSATGTPGAVSNQAGKNNPKDTKTSTAAVTTTQPTPTNTQKDNTVNYEIDKTVNYVSKSMGGINRLSVAVLVNHKKEVDDQGKATYRPLNDDEKNQITLLVKDAMGFNQDRGDSLNVVNSLFTEPEKEEVKPDPIWKPYATISTAKSIFQYLITAVVLFILYSKVLKPLLKRINEDVISPSVGDVQLAAAGVSNMPMNSAPTGNTSPAEPSQNPQFDKNGNEVTPQRIRRNVVKQSKDSLELAQEMASQDPKIVAGIIKNWVNENE